MAVTEESRHDLYTYFDETMGRERSTTLMELLPPVGWGDVATKQFVTTEIALVRKDIERIETRLTDRMDGITDRLTDRMDGMTDRMNGMATKEDLANLKADILDKMNKQLLAFVGLNVTLFGLSVGVVTQLR